MMHQPNLTPNPDKNNYCVVDDYPYQYGNINIVVPACFIYDGASIPPMGWRMTYTPFHPKVMAPALLHDWLYINHQIDRQTADQILYDTLIFNGAGHTRAKLIHAAVKKFGGQFWGLTPADRDKLEILHIIAKESDLYAEYHFPDVE